MGRGTVGEHRCQRPALRPASHSKRDWFLVPFVSESFGGLWIRHWLPSNQSHPGYLPTSFTLCHGPTSEFISDPGSSLAMARPRLSPSPSTSGSFHPSPMHQLLALDPPWTRPGSTLDPPWPCHGSALAPPWIRPGSAPASFSGNNEAMKTGHAE